MKMSIEGGTSHSNFVWLIAIRCRPIRLAKALWYDQQERDYCSDHTHDARLA